MRKDFGSKKLICGQTNLDRITNADRILFCGLQAQSEALVSSHQKSIEPGSLLASPGKDWVSRITSYGLAAEG